MGAREPATHGGSAGGGQRHTEAQEAVHPLKPVRVDRRATRTHACSPRQAGAMGVASRVEMWHVEPKPDMLVGEGFASMEGNEQLIVSFWDN